MANSNTIMLKINADGSIAVAETGRVSGAVTDLGRKVESETASIGSRIKKHWLGITAVVMGTYLTLKKAISFIEINKEFENFAVQLETILGSSEAAQSALRWIEQFTAKTPFELADVTEAFVLLKAVGIDAFEHLRTVGDAAASMNKSLLNTATAVISMEREVLRRYGIDVKREMDKATFTYTTAMGERIVKVAQGGDDIQKAVLLSIWNERFQGGMERFSKAYSGMWSNIQDIITLFIKEIGAAGLWEQLKTQVRAVLNLMEDAFDTGRAQSFAAVIATEVYKSFAAIKGLLESILNLLRGFETPLKFTGTILGAIIEGWRLIFTLLPPITERIGLIIDAMWDWAKIAFNIGRIIMGAIRLDIGEIKSAWADAKSAFWESGRKTGEALSGGLLTEMDSRLQAYYKTMKTAKDINKELAEGGAGGGKATEELKEVIKLNEQIQKQIDKMTFSPIQQIEKQAQAWIDAGADKVKVQEWVNLQLEELNLGYLAKITAQNEEAAAKELERQTELHERVNELRQQEAEFRVQMYEDSWQQMMDIANQIGGEMGMGLGMMSAGMKGIADIYAGEDPYSQRLEQIQEFLREKAALQMEGAISELELERYVHEKEIEWDKITQQQKLSMTLNTLSIIQGALISFGAFSDKNSKALFLLTKAVGIAMIWVQTQIAAMSAAAAVAGIPIVGPALASAAYAKMQLLGYISMAAAAAATIGQMAAGGGGVGGAISGGGGYTYTSPTEPRWEREEEKQPTQIINYHFYGTVIGDLDEAGRALAPAIDKAKSDGV